MRSLACLIFTLPLVALPGCGRARLVGTYRAEIRVMQGKQESQESGYSLAEVQARAAQDQRALTLRSNGRYEWRSGDAVNEGNWRIEERTLILRDDTYNGNPILPALQEDRRWRIRRSGEIVNEKTYSYYNLEEVYTRAK